MGSEDFYDIGDAVRVEIEFKDENGDLGDPTNVTFTYKVGRSGTPTVYAFGTDAELVKDSVGTYHVDILVAEAKPHYVKFSGTGGLDATEEDVFYVNKSYFA